MSICASGRGFTVLLYGCTLGGTQNGATQRGTPGYNSTLGYHVMHHIWTPVTDVFTIPHLFIVCNELCFHMSCHHVNSAYDLARLQAPYRTRRVDTGCS